MHRSAGVLAGWSGGVPPPLGNAGVDACEPDRWP